MKRNDIKFMCESTRSQVRRTKLQLLRMEKRMALLEHFLVLLQNMGEFDICTYRDYIVKRMFTLNGTVENDSYDRFYHEAVDLCEMMETLCAGLGLDYQWSIGKLPYEKSGVIYEGVLIDEMLDAFYLTYIDKDELKCSIQKVVLKRYPY